MGRGPYRVWFKGIDYPGKPAVWAPTASGHRCLQEIREHKYQLSSSIDTGK